MELSHLIAFNLALLAAIASPGPAFLVALKTTLCAGRLSGVSIGLGLGLVACLWTLAALLGLDAVFTVFPWAYIIAKILGAAYLIIIAARMWRDADAPIATETASPPPNIFAAGAFRQGVMINLLNPKSVLFAAAVLVVIFPAGMTATENLIVVANQFAIEALFYTALAFGISRPTVRTAYLCAKAHIDRAAAGLLGLMGLRLLVSR